MTIRTFFSYLAILSFVFIGIFSFISQTHASSTAVSGWWWSDNIGWISMSGVTIDDSTHLMSGSAWSDNIGWIKFDGLSGFPSGGGSTSGAARLNTVTNMLEGWARACDGTASGDCSSMTSRTDGWDGWISLSGTNYGVTLSGTNFSGFAWGSDVVGWVDASLSTYSPVVSPTGTLVLSASPTNVSAIGNTTTLTWQWQQGAGSTLHGCTADVNTTDHWTNASASINPSTAVLNSGNSYMDSRSGIVVPNAPSHYQISCLDSTGTQINSNIVYVTVNTPASSFGWQTDCGVGSTETVTGNVDMDWDFYGIANAGTCSSTGPSGAWASTSPSSNEWHGPTSIGGVNGGTYSLSCDSGANGNSGTVTFTKVAQCSVQPPTTHHFLWFEF